MIDKYYTLEDERYTRLHIAFDEASKNIPSELRIAELDEITKSILDSIGICLNEEILTLQIKLLSISLNKELKNSLHISFTNALQKLSSDEILILHNIHFNSYEFIQTCDYEKGKGFYNYQYQQYDYPKNELSIPDNFSFYMFHLQEILKIVRWPIYKQDPLIENNQQIGLVQYSRLVETEYGERFNKCLFE